MGGIFCTRIIIPLDVSKPLVASRAVFRTKETLVRRCRCSHRSWPIMYHVAVSGPCSPFPANSDSSEFTATLRVFETAFESGSIRSRILS